MSEKEQLGERASALPGKASSRPKAASHWASKEQGGQALVEFALVLPILLALALGLAVISELGVARLVLEHGAAEGARAVALTNDDARARTTVLAAVAPLDPQLVTVEIDPPFAQRPLDPRGTLVRVGLAYPLAVPLSFAGLSRLVLRGAAARRIEWTP